MNLPTTAALKGDEKKERPARVLIVQTEIDTVGKKTYGVITLDGLRVMSESELTDIKSFAEVEKEEKEKAEKEKDENDS